MIVLIALVFVGLAGNCFGVFVGFCLYHFGSWAISRCFAVNGEASR